MTPPDGSCTTTESVAGACCAAGAAATAAAIGLRRVITAAAAEGGVAIAGDGLGARTTSASAGAPWFAPPTASAVIGSATATMPMTAARHARRVSGWRFVFSVSMAEILLSRVDGCAIAGADTHALRRPIACRATSSRWLAYSVASTPPVSTASSHAYSLSCRRRRQGDPRQGVDPVKGAEHFCAHVNQPVATADVRHLVRQHDATAWLAPFGGAGREDDLRRDQSPRHQQRGVVALENLDVPQSEFRRQSIRGLAPGSGKNRRTSRGDAGQPHDAGDQPEQSDERAGEPREDHNRRPGQWDRCGCWRGFTDGQRRHIRRESQCRRNPRRRDTECRERYWPCRQDHLERRGGSAGED